MADASPRFSSKLANELFEEAQCRARLRSPHPWYDEKDVLRALIDVMLEHVEKQDARIAALEGKEEKDSEEFSYRVSWSQDDMEYVGLCTRFPSLSYLASTKAEALRGIRGLVADAIDDVDTLERTGQETGETGSEE